MLTVGYPWLTEQEGVVDTVYQRLFLGAQERILTPIMGMKAAETEIPISNMGQLFQADFKAPIEHFFEATSPFLQLVQNQRIRQG